MATIADQMVANGATVLAIVALDSESGAAIQKKAAAQGVQTIDYDRLVLGGSSDYYVSFDNVEVGKLQGEGLVKCLGDGAHKSSSSTVPTDNNAALFKQGAHSVIDANSNITVVVSRTFPTGLPQPAGRSTSRCSPPRRAGTSPACSPPMTGWPTPSSP